MPTHTLESSTSSSVHNSACSSSRTRELEMEKFFCLLASSNKRKIADDIRENARRVKLKEERKKKSFIDVERRAKNGSFTFFYFWLRHIHLPAFQRPTKKRHRRLFQSQYKSIRGGRKFMARFVGFDLSATEEEIFPSSVTSLRIRRICFFSFDVESVDESLFIADEIGGIFISSSARHFKRAQFS